MSEIDGLWKFGNKLVILTEVYGSIEKQVNGIFKVEMKVVTGRGPMATYNRFLTSVMPSREYYITPTNMIWMDRGLWICFVQARMYSSGLGYIADEVMNNAARKKMLDELMDLRKIPITGSGNKIEWGRGGG